jgi:hypothetical protein
MNNGLSPEGPLKVAFPDVIAVQRPLLAVQEIKDPEWIAGFVEGEVVFLLRFKILRLERN